MSEAARRGGRVVGLLSGVVLLAAIATACQQRLTSPAECPELCPGGETQVFDTVLTPVPLRDSTFSGYVNRGAGVALLVSNGFAVSENRAAYRFAARIDSIEVRDTLRRYTVDSVALGLTLIARDTLVNGLKLYLYRISEEVDASLTFDGLQSQLVEANLIDSIAVPDSVNAGAVRTVLTGAELDKVALPTEGSGVLAIGVTMAAAQPSGVRIGSIRNATGATFTSFVTVDVPDTTTSIRKQTLGVNPTFNTYLTPVPLLPESDFLTVGGDSSSRAIIRFSLPQRIEDSASILRATLELIPRGPIPGLPTDPAVLDAKAVLADLGAKSPVTTDARFIVADTLSPNSADTVRLDVTRIVQLWQADSNRPHAVFLSLLPEAASFTRAVFGSTRSDPDVVANPPQPVGAPRLRVTYLRPFPFENP